MTRRARLTRLLFMLALVGCTEDTPPTSQPDIDTGMIDAAPDVAVLDGGLDVSVVDAIPIDLAVPVDRDLITDASPDTAPPLDGAPDAAPPPIDAAPPPIDAAPPPIDAAPDLAPDACVPDCGERTCGEDGCGGVCGVCGPDAPLCIDDLCTPPPPIRINEVVASNDASLLDEDGDSPDWVELYNSGPDTVDLEGWFITDDPEDLSKWAFPAVDMPGGAYRVIFCSDKDRDDPAQPLHTDFKLSSDGEFLALVMPDGETIVDAYDPAVPALPEDHAHGVEQAVERVVLVPAGSVLPYTVAVDRSLEPADPAFDDAHWPTGAAGLGYAEVVVPEPDAIANLALGQPVSQSSTLNGFVAENGNNGDLDDFTHTASDDDAATWTVDLDGPSWIGQVVVHNRRGCCGTRLRDITVEILDGDDGAIWASPLLNPENALGAPARLTVDLIEEGGVIGHGVRISRTADPDLSGTGGAGNADEAAVLSLGEVEVLGGAGEALARVETDVGPALRAATGLWVRLPFTVDPEARFDTAVLDIAYDAGVVIWLDGAPIAARNAPGADALALPETPWLAFDEPADPRVERVALDPALLGPGEHLLAVLVLDSAPDGVDMVVDLALEALTVSDGERRFFSTPTPGGPNETPGFDGFVDPVAFDPPRGLYDDPLVVRLSSATPDATIHYTTDGSPPDLDDPIYDADGIPVDAITTLRALAVREGFEPAPATAASYLFLDEVIGEDFDTTVARGFPPAWGGTGADYGMDPRVTGPDDDYAGRYAEVMRDSLIALPSMLVTADIDGFFGPDGIYTQSGRRGVAWERPISLEYIDPAGESWQVNCGVRVQGGAFRSHGLTKKHSLRVLFKTIYGPGKLRWPLFGPDASDRLDGFTLRANSNDGWQWAAARGQPLFIRDSFGRETHLAMGGISSHETWVHLYINGVYWGLYNPVERPDASFGTHYLGGDRDAWDAVSNDQAADGDTQAWQALRAMASDGLGDLAALWRLEGIGPDGLRDPDQPAWLDVDAYIDYMLVNIWGGNSDWPHKNWWIGRPRDGARGFRFFMWDSEWSIGLRSNLGTNKIGDARGVALPWNALLQNPEFQVRVGDRVHRHWSPGGVFYVDPEAPDWDPEAPERNRPAALFDRLADTIELALVAESARWGDQHADVPYTVDEHWAVERDRQLAEYFPARSARVLDHLRQADLYPPTSAPAFAPAPGVVEPGTALTLTAGAGVVWFTIDGRDPREPGGAVSPDALGGEPEVAIALPPREVIVQARVLDDQGWSPMVEGRYRLPADP